MINKSLRYDFLNFINHNCVCLSIYNILSLKNIFPQPFLLNSRCSLLEDYESLKSIIVKSLIIIEIYVLYSLHLFTLIIWCIRHITFIFYEVYSFWTFKWSMPLLMTIETCERTLTCRFGKNIICWASTWIRIRLRWSLLCNPFRCSKFFDLIICNFLGLDSVLDHFINAIKMLECNYVLDINSQTMKISINKSFLVFICITPSLHCHELFLILDNRPGSLF